ncbi:acyl-CoA thioesterase [Paludibacterium yongneupense]|uniref:acyl-CoA thioesterase n=1 Tax=Paludibacterium yongneupense TaxID=400061 RepID=UPI000410A6E7|nr:thioesterase family protein [Paludibacterium yongneupense]
MARVQIDLPENLPFETVLDIRIGDINYGNHMANDAILRLAHEARLRLLKTLGYSELDIEGVGIIMSDAAISYRAEAFHGDRLRFRLGAGDSGRHGFDLVYHVVDDSSGREVARLKTGIVFYNYSTKKIAAMPERFLERLADAKQEKESINAQLPH